MGFLDKLRGRDTSSSTAPTPNPYGSSSRATRYYGPGTDYPRIGDSIRGEQRRRKQTVRLVRTGEAATGLDMFKDTGINMRKGAEASRARMRADGVLGIRARGVAVWDHSWSMEGDYENDAVQALGEMTLAHMLQFCEFITLFAFDSGVYAPIRVDLSNYRDVVRAQVYKPGAMGSTNLADALRLVRDIVAAEDVWAFVNVLTDGVPNGYRPNHAQRSDDDEPGDAPEVTEIVCDLASYGCMLKFTGVREVDYLQFLDDLEKFRPGARLLDNCDTKLYPGGLGSLTPDQFANDMAEEMASTIAAQERAGIVVPA